MLVVRDAHFTISHYDGIPLKCDRKNNAKMQKKRKCKRNETL